MHQDIGKSRHQKGLCMRISANEKHDAHAFQAKLTEALNQGFLTWGAEINFSGCWERSHMWR